jgi:nitrate/nitrite transporter NarK
VHSLIAAVAVGAIFTEAGNGANFGVVPHVLPANNGIVSGLTGASGNFGGIIFNLVFRFNGTDYHKAYWIIGIISLALALSVSWIRVPKVHPVYEASLTCSSLERLVGSENLAKDIFKEVEFVFGNEKCIIMF